MATAVAALGTLAAVVAAFSTFGASQKRGSLDRLEALYREWEGPRMLRLRAILGAGLLTFDQLARPSDLRIEALDHDSVVALTEVVDFMERVAWSVRHGLIHEEAAYEFLSSSWELYWRVLGPLVHEARPNPSYWEWVVWLIPRFVKRTLKERTKARPEAPLTEVDLRRFLRHEIERSERELRMLRELQTGVISYRGETANPTGAPVARGSAAPLDRGPQAAFWRRLIDGLLKPSARS